MPCEASFSDWFARFANGKFAEMVHEALVREAHKDVPVHNVSRDSTSIEAREKPASKAAKPKLKDNYGGRYVRLRGAVKVMSHLMFGVLALTAMRLVTLGT